MTEIRMPPTSGSMRAGIIVRRLNADGETVSVADQLVEIDSDKATVVYAAQTARRLRISATERLTAAVGDPIAWTGSRADTTLPPQALPARARAARLHTAVAPRRRMDAPRARDRHVVALPSVRGLARVYNVAQDALRRTGAVGQITDANVDRLGTDQGPPERDEQPERGERIRPGATNLLSDIRALFESPLRMV